MQTIEEMSDCHRFRRTQTPKELLDVDGSRARHIASFDDRADTIDCRAAPQVVDQHGRIQHDVHGSTDAQRVAEALAAHPAGRIIVPFVSAVAENPGRLPQMAPATLSLHRGTHGITDERTPAPGSGDGVDLGDERAVELYVHSHVYIYGV